MDSQLNQSAASSHSPSSSRSDGKYACPHVGCTHTRNRRADVHRHALVCRMRPDSQPKVATVMCPAPNCRKTHNQQSQYKQHYRTKHAGEAGKIFKCTACQEGFADRKQCERHVEKCSHVDSSVLNAVLERRKANNRVGWPGLMAGRDTDYPVPAGISLDAGSAAGGKRSRVAREQNSSTRASKRARNNDSTATLSLFQPQAPQAIMDPGLQRLMPAQSQVGMLDSSNVYADPAMPSWGLQPNTQEAGNFDSLGAWQGQSQVNAQGPNNMYVDPASMSWCLQSNTQMAVDFGLQGHLPAQGQAGVQDSSNLYADPTSLSLGLRPTTEEAAHFGSSGAWTAQSDRFDPAVLEQEDDQYSQQQSEDRLWAALDDVGLGGDSPESSLSDSEPLARDFATPPQQGDAQEDSSDEELWRAHFSQPEDQWLTCDSTAFTVC